MCMITYPLNYKFLFYVSILQEQIECLGESLSVKAVYGYSKPRAYNKKTTLKSNQILSNPMLCIIEYDSLQAMLILGPLKNGKTFIKTLSIRHINNQTNVTYSERLFKINWFITPNFFFTHNCYLCIYLVGQLVCSQFD